MLWLLDNGFRGRILARLEKKANKLFRYHPWRSLCYVSLHKGARPLRD